MSNLFRSLLTPQQLAEVERERAEIRRLSSLTDRWFAEELLKLARSVRSQPTFSFKQVDRVYDAVLFWHVVPEIAYRLGATQFQTGERSLESIRSMTLETLTSHLQVCLGNANRHYPGCMAADLIFDATGSDCPVIHGLIRVGRQYYCTTGIENEYSPGDAPSSSS
jgi:hypothetical protein